MRVLSVGVVGVRGWRAHGCGVAGGISVSRGEMAVQRRRRGPRVAGGVSHRNTSPTASAPAGAAEDLLPRWGLLFGGRGPVAYADRLISG